MVRQIILAGFVVMLPVRVHAQGRGAMVAVPRAAVAPQVAAPASHAGSSQAMLAARVLVKPGVPRVRGTLPVVRSTRPVGTRVHFANNRTGNRPDCGSAPGFGFDAVHQAAVCGPGAFGSQRGGFQVPFFFPFFDGGFALPGTVAAVDENAALDGVQQDVTEAEIRDLRRRVRALQAETAPPPRPAPVVPVAALQADNAAPPSNDGFVFVRRDGTVFFAVAYAWENGTLRYVTNEGLRHSVTQESLDLEATRQFNEQRGLLFRSPA